MNIKVRHILIVAMFTLGTLIPATLLNADGYYDNPVYFFSIKYDPEKMASVIGHTPPHPDHGILFELKQGGKIAVLGDGWHVQELFFDLVKDCKVERTPTKFKYYYVCKDQIRAAYLRMMPYRCVLYSVNYYEFGDNIDLDFFQEILLAFKEEDSTMWFPILPPRR